MKLHLDSSSDSRCIGAYGVRQFTIGGAVFTTPVLVTRDAIVTERLPARFDDLTQQHVDLLVDLAPDIVVIGTGRTQQLVDPALAYPLLERGIGVESMDTGAACRCYNVLVAESRSVAALLFLIEH